jgi:hypothetical protein
VSAISELLAIRKSQTQRVVQNNTAASRAFPSKTDLQNDDKSTDFSGAPFLRRQLKLGCVEVIPSSSCGAQSRGMFKQTYNGLSLREAYESVAPSVFNLAVLLDLNDDGKLEVIVHSFYYEGGQTPIYRSEPDKIEKCCRF